jgi:hypothetical protein
MIRFVGVEKDLSGFDLDKYYKVIRRNKPGWIPEAIATTFEEAYDACTVLIEIDCKNKKSYTIIPPKD